MRQDLGPGLLVATTHVLFNPKRGDIKVPLPRTACPAHHFSADLHLNLHKLVQPVTYHHTYLQHDLLLAASSKGTGLQDSIRKLRDYVWTDK